MNQFDEATKPHASRINVQKLLDGLREMKDSRNYQARESIGLEQVRLWAEAELIGDLCKLVESCVVKP